MIRLAIVLEIVTIHLPRPNNYSAAAAAAAASSHKDLSTHTSARCENKNVVAALSYKTVRSQPLARWENSKYNVQCCRIATV